MFKLHRLNVERVTDSEHVRDKLISQGYTLVVEQQATNEPEKNATPVGTPDNGETNQTPGDDKKPEEGGEAKEDSKPGKKATSTKKAAE